MVIASRAQWHAKKETSIHERFEDGTLPFHNIFAPLIHIGVFTVQWQIYLLTLESLPNTFTMVLPR